MRKPVFYTEIAYMLGELALAVGTAMMEKGGFGVSMVVAPAYVLHLKISQYLPFFSFGMAEYTFQALVILLLMLLLRKAKLSYLFSFVTAVLYSLMLDGMIALLAVLPPMGMAARIAMYGGGILTCSFGVALMFHTYIPPAAYEMFVKEVTKHFALPLHKFKTAYDCISYVISIALSFTFFGLMHFEGVGWGTVVCALANGTLISLWTKLLEKGWQFKDGLRK